MEYPIPVYAVNLKERTERFEHIHRQFENRNEFSLTVVDAIKHEVGGLGLWETIRNITKIAIEKDHSYFILCEDDHLFTEEYTKEKLLRNINAALEQKADILSGGPSWTSSFLPINKELYWVELFNGLQFTVLFKKFYQIILDTDVLDNDGADFRMGRLTENKFFIYPYISTQKFFGYSDATLKNNQEGKVERYFVDTTESIRLVNHVRNYFAFSATDKNEIANFDRYLIPTYIINWPQRIEQKKQIIEQFRGKPEFDITVVQACTHEIREVGLWQSIRKVIKMAIENDDDVIVICEDVHQFTEDYTREYLLRNIIDASQQGIDFLSGGARGFGIAAPVSENRFWINSVLSTQFIVVYRNLFQAILDEPFDDNVKPDQLFSELSANKMILYPFVSVQNDFGYSDAPLVHNNFEGSLTETFIGSQRRLSVIKKVLINRVIKQNAF